MSSKRQHDQEQADDFAHLLRALTVGRRYAIGRYVFLLAAGVASWWAPSLVLRDETNPVVSAVCSALWIGCGLTCLVSAIRDKRDGEYFGIPGVGLGLVAFAAALVWNAVRDDLVTLPYAFFILSLVASLGKRQAELRVLRAADRSSSGRAPK